MGETAAYCSDCYNALAKSSSPDKQIAAAEQAGKVPMTKQGSCGRCGKATIVMYYEV